MGRPARARQVPFRGRQSLTRARVLVTGGAGFIGANLIRALCERDYEVTVFDNLSTGTRQRLAGVPVELIVGDILDREAITAAVDGHSSVVHLAAQSGVPTSVADPRRDCELNVVGTLNVLEAIRTAGRADARLVFASSNAPLGRQSPPATEDKAPIPVSPYGASKLAAEGYCLAYQGTWGVGTVVLRFGNVYGPFSGHKSSVVARFLKDILETGTITIDGDGGQTRDFIFVGDLCAAIWRALESDVAGEVFQVATGEETSIAELAERVRAAIGRDFTVASGAVRQGDVRKNYSDITKARQILKWNPGTDLDTGLKKTADWFIASTAEASE